MRILTVAVALALTMLPTRAAVVQSDHGSISGRVTFEGTPPPPTPVVVAGGSQPVIHVDRSGGLRYAVVYLPEARAGTGAPDATVTLNQRQFVFEPQVLAIRAGQTVRFTNDDPANHNVRSQDSNPANTFSIDTAAGSAGPHTHRFAAVPAGRPLELTCDLHPWMAAWVYVFDQDRFAITAADGSFRIDRVPPGRHRLAVRQPSGGLARDLAVDVRTGDTARVEVRFTPADVGMPSR